MCWNQTIVWTDEGGEGRSIEGFAEWVCAFCMAYPDKGTPEDEPFPERVAAANEDPDQFTQCDIDAARRLGARNLSDEVAGKVIDKDKIQAKLQAIRVTWDLSNMSDATFDDASQRVRNLILVLCDINGIALATATKLAYLKRPALIPICDSLIQEAILGQQTTDAGDVACIMMKFRRLLNGHKHLLTQVQTHLNACLPEDDAYRTWTPLRMLDAVLWYHRKNGRPGYDRLLLHD